MSKCSAISTIRRHPEGKYSVFGMIPRTLYTVEVVRLLSARTDNYRGQYSEFRDNGYRHFLVDINGHSVSIQVNIGSQLSISASQLWSTGIGGHCATSLYSANIVISWSALDLIRDYMVNWSLLWHRKWVYKWYNAPLIAYVAMYWHDPWVQPWLGTFKTHTL